MSLNGWKWGALAPVLLLWGCAAQVPLDTRSALESAARTGDKEAQFQLGKAYCCGYGPGKDTHVALSWLCKAAKQEHPGAQYEMGRYYGLRTDTHYGSNQAQDRIYAYMWYSLAAVGDWPLAAAERDALANDMTKGELKEAQSHLRDWRTLGCRE